MAKDDKPSASDKGKGKDDDIRELNGEKDEDKSKSEKDDKPTVNGKKDEEPKDGTGHPSFLDLCLDGGASNVLRCAYTDTFLTEDLNEEDQQLKNDLEMLVERLHVSYLFVPLLKAELHSDLISCRSQIQAYTNLHSNPSRPSSRP